MGTSDQRHRKATIRRRAFALRDARSGSSNAGTPPRTQEKEPRPTRARSSASSPRDEKVESTHLGRPSPRDGGTTRSRNTNRQEGRLSELRTSGAQSSHVRTRPTRRASPPLASRQGSPRSSSSSSRSPWPAPRAPLHLHLSSSRRSTRQRAAHQSSLPPRRGSPPSCWRS